MTDIAEINRYVADRIERASALREASYDKTTDRYGRSNGDAAIAACADNPPFAKIIACLLTAGFCDMFEFVEEVKLAAARDAYVKL